jgi:hypothetical protein
LRLSRFVASVRHKAMSEPIATPTSHGSKIQTVASIHPAAPLIASPGASSGLVDCQARPR